MYKTARLIIAALLCAPALAAADDAVEPPQLSRARSAGEVVDQFVSWSVKYCKDQEMQGVDFATCYKKATDAAIERLRRDRKVVTE